VQAVQKVLEALRPEPKDPDLSSAGSVAAHRKSEDDRAMIGASVADRALESIHEAHFRDCGTAEGTSYAPSLFSIKVADLLGKIVVERIILAHTDDDHAAIEGAHPPSDKTNRKEGTS
jgi:hypothetical protein